MPVLVTPPTLERVLQGLYPSEIRCEIQNEPPAGGITAWIDFGSRTEKATFYGTIVGDRQVWPAADRIAAWLHETALRLFPDSPYAKEHSTEAPKKVASAVEKTAVRIMRNLYEATGGESQHWESLGNLGATKADAAGIAYAVERDSPAATPQTIAESHLNAHHSHGWYAAMQDERRRRARRPHATMSIDQTQDAGARLERKTGLGDRPCKTTTSFWRASIDVSMRP